MSRGTVKDAYMLLGDIDNKVIAEENASDPHMWAWLSDQATKQKQKVQHAASHSTLKPSL